MRLSSAPIARLLALGSLAILGLPATARASDISFVDSYRNLANLQTGNGNTVSQDGAYFSIELNTTVPNAYTSASFTRPAGSPVPLAHNGPSTYKFQSGLYATQAAMNSAFPTGLYSVTGVNGGTDTTTFSYTTNDYPASAPYLTGTDYSDLQGMNASQAFTFHITPFTAGATSSHAYTFFSIYDETTSTTVLQDSFLSPGTTSISIAGGTLAAGDTYSYEIDDSNRDSVSSPGAEFDALLGFENRTEGFFSTASPTVTPEPGSLILLGTGLLGAAGLRRRR